MSEPTRSLRRPRQCRSRLRGASAVPVGRAAVSATRSSRPGFQPARRARRPAGHHAASRDPVGRDCPAVDLRALPGQGRHRAAHRSGLLQRPAVAPDRCPPRLAVRCCSGRRAPAPRRCFGRPGPGPRAVVSRYWQSTTGRQGHASDNTKIGGERVMPDSTESGDDRRRDVPLMVRLPGYRNSRVGMTW